MNYESKKEIRAILEEQGITVKKRWGQNFLVNRHAREQIVGLLESSHTDIVWEIGPGLGALTSLLIPLSKKLIAFEIDHGMIRSLTSLLPENEKFIIQQGDAVRQFEDACTQTGYPDRIIGNLPYSSASKMISKLIELEIFPKKLVFTVQKELALRMTAKPGTKSYSSFSVFCQAFFDIKLETDLGGGSFFPEPDVVSSVISLIPNVQLETAAQKQLFSVLIRTGFASRRKMFLKNASGITGFGPDFQAGIRNFLLSNMLSEKARAEEISVSQFIELSKKLVSGE